MSHKTRTQFQKALQDLMAGLELYADAHRNAYGTPIGEDGVLGEEWLAMVADFRGLLKGERGSLDGGTLDRWCRNIVARNGFTQAEAMAVGLEGGKP